MGWDRLGRRVTYGSLMDFFLKSRTPKAEGSISHRRFLRNDPKRSNQEEISALLLCLILASLRGVLYVGLTDEMWKRMIQHKSGTFDGFTKKYKVDRLMYLETYSDSKIAAAREQQIKKFRREKKIALFTGSNPGWKDLTSELFSR
jgi:putative endonuclease